jgi:glycerol-3-phosphate dehydrogenase (NAD(P)+)
MTEIIEQELGEGKHQIGLITGPNLADELIIRQPAGAVAASSDSDLVTTMIELFTNPYFRVYPSKDLVGCELAGATKSVIALAVGMAIGLGYGENTQSMIITRGLGEVARFGIGYGADPLTNLGLAGMGDLVASCGSPLSRNRTFGEVLGRTGSMAQASTEITKTVEGVASARAIRELAHRVGVEVPIIEVVSEVVSGSMTPTDAMHHLMSVSLRAELA